MERKFYFFPDEDENGEFIPFRENDLSAWYKVILSALIPQFCLFSMPIIAACCGAIAGLFHGGAAFLLNDGSISLLKQAPSAYTRFSNWLCVIYLAAGLCFFVYSRVYDPNNPGVRERFIENWMTLAVGLLPLILLIYYFTHGLAKDELKSVVFLLVVFFACAFFAIRGFFKCFLAYDIEQRAYMAFYLSLTCFGFATIARQCLGSIDFAALGVPIQVPYFEFHLLDGWLPITFDFSKSLSVPGTESLGFLLMLLGLYADPATSVVQSLGGVFATAVFALYIAGIVLFLRGRAWLEQSKVVIPPAYELIAFVLLVLAGCVEIALHAGNIPEPSPALVVINRLFALFALAVVLFWRKQITVPPTSARGALGAWGRLTDEAASQAIGMAYWALGLTFVWMVMTYIWKDGLPYWVGVGFSALVCRPLYLLMGLFSYFKDSIHRHHFNQAAELEAAAHEPPQTAPTKAQVREALRGGGRGDDGRNFHDTGD